MSWVQVALGLLREAVTSETGKDVINSVRGSSVEPSPPQTANIEALLADHRMQMDRNLENVVRMLNTQNQKVTVALRQQRIWNTILAIGILISVLIALLR
jgi:hypothetical protein